LELFEVGMAVCTVEKKLKFVFDGAPVDAIRNFFNILKREGHGSCRRDGE
jgi:hypothetical protein